MRARHVLLLSVLAIAFAFTAVADDAEAHAESAASKNLDEPGKWQIFFAAANLYPRLEESEGKVEKLINGGLGRTVHFWREPVTFGDWAKDGKMWDFQIGVGRDVGEKTVVHFSVGGTYGKQENSEWYIPLGVPTGIDVDFTRSLWFVSSGVNYYFLGRPEMPEKKEGQSFLARRLLAARPYVECTAGYVNLKTNATITLNRPLMDNVFHYQDKARYDLFYISPRVGVELPVTKRDSIGLAAGYLFFTNHCEEANNLSIYTTVRHRF
ncbi:MAG: hypothetical protein GY851_12855 [bacterium]|nr:hypothetical protein [bacterium]